MNNNNPTPSVEQGIKLNILLTEGKGHLFSLRERAIIFAAMTEYASQLLGAKEKEIEGLKNYIHEIRPKHDAYDSVCHALGIESDILGHFKTKEKQLDHYKALYEEAKKYLPQKGHDVAEYYKDEQNPLNQE